MSMRDMNRQYQCHLQKLGGTAGPTFPFNYAHTNPKLHPVAWRGSKNSNRDHFTYDQKYSSL